MRGRLVRKAWQHDPARYAPPRYRRACSYEAFIPDPIREIEVTLSGDSLATLSDAEARIRALNARAEPALAPFARLLLRTESIASSKVEGLQVDVRDLARAEAKLDTGRSAASRALEILANVDAMQLAIEEATSPQGFDEGHVVAIHEALMTAAPNAAIAGQIRNEQNWIGGNDYNPCGADFVPPPHEDLRELLDDLCRAIGADTLPPLVHAAVVHAQFETIHPFLDGNGRTGRALIHVILRRRDLAPSFVPPISVVLAGDRDGYIRGLTQYRQGDVSGWIERFCVATARSAELANAYLTEVTKLQEHWRELLRVQGAPRSDAAAWAVIDALPAHPVVTVAVATATTQRTKPAVNQAIAQLEHAGVLVPLSRSARNRAWEASGLLDLLAGLEAGTAPG
jgi:Fic family protein